MKKLLLLIPAVCLLCSCFQGQPINYPFDDVVIVLKDKFMKKDRQFQAVSPELEEKPDYMYMYIQDNIDFFLLIKIKIKLKKDEEQTSKIMIRVEEYTRQWSYTKRVEDMEKAFFQCLEKRMETGKWDPLPWHVKYKTKRKKTENEKNF